MDFPYLGTYWDFDSLRAMNTRIVTILLILSHITISTVWASSHSTEDIDDGCGDCIGYESPHIHISGGYNQQAGDHDDHNFSSAEQEQQHNDEYHEDSHHVHLVFEISKGMLWQAYFEPSSEQNALRDGHFFHRTVAPPVPPPTA